MRLTMKTLCLVFLMLFFIPGFAQIGAKTQQNKIQGTWHNNADGYQMTLILNADGSGEFDGEAIKYIAKDGKFAMTIVAESETLNYSYSLNGNSLTMSGGDLEGPVIFNRAGTATEQSATPSTVQSNNSNSDGKRVAQELVGKWCYVNVNSTNSGGSSTEQCITLRADGTYEYYGETSRTVNTNAYAGGTNSQNSDRGTWTYDGARVYYSSSVGAGSGSYVLEKKNHPKNNDPMIVLDGTAYVTYYQKSPWR